MHDAYMTPSLGKYRKVENIFSSPSFFSPTISMQTRSSHSPTNSGDDINTRKNAIWTVREEAELIYALSKSKAEMTGTSFREAAYTYAVGEIQPFYERGMRKDVRSCKNKWNNVCISLYMLYWYPDVHN